MSFGSSPTTIDFSDGITLVQGSNGVGKSTVFIALFYVLYGKPYKKCKLVSLINDKNKEKMEVSVEFNSNDIKYKIVRGLKPSIFQIYENDKLVSQHSSIAEHQDYLQTYILKINENVFKQLIFLGANTSGVSFIGMSKSEREELFQIVSDTSLFQDLTEKLKEREKECKIKLSNIEYKVATLSGTISEREKEIQRLEEFNRSIVESHARKSLEYQETLKRNIYDLVCIKDKVEESKSIGKELFNKRKLLIEEQTNTNNSLRKLEDNILERRTLEERYSMCLGCEKLVDILPKGSNIEVFDLKEELSKRQALINTELVNIESKLEREKSYVLEHKNILSDLAKLESSASESIECAEFVEIHYLDFEDKKHKLQGEIDNLSNTKQELKNIENLKSILNNSNLKDLVMSSHLSLLNKLINIYIQNFEDFNFTLLIDSNLKETITSNAGKEIEFYSLSSGQQMRLFYAILFGFLELIQIKNGVKVNLLVLDEVLDTSLDVMGKNELLRIIQNTIKNKEIFIISHNLEISSELYFSKVYSVSVEKNVSKWSILK